MSETEVCKGECTTFRFSEEQQQWVCSVCGTVPDSDPFEDNENYSDPICPHCHGSGVHWDGPELCEWCDGEGYEWWR